MLLYDPLVLRLFLPTCDVAQLKEFFGPVQKFICGDEEPAFVLLFSFDGKRLVTERVAADTVFPAMKEANATEVLPAANNDNSDSKDNTTQQEKKPPRRFFY